MRIIKKWFLSFKLVRKSLRKASYFFNGKPKLICHECGYDRFAKFSDRNYKMCLDCDHKIEWFLKDKQPPLIKTTR